MMVHMLVVCDEYNTVDMDRHMRILGIIMNGPRSKRRV